MSGSEQHETFDFVIAGGGSAGCVLANRLSDDPSVRVCLLEAGPPDRNPLIHIPIGVVALMQHRKLNWRFETVPQPGAAGRAIYIPRGRALGGSSSINGMVYIRGHKLDYDDWAAAGNPGWSYRDVLPYFRKSENNEVFGDTPYHGKGGPLNVTNVTTHSPLDDMLLEATDSLQLKRSADFNGAEQEGFGLRQATQRRGRRHSAAQAYLAPVRNRPNLTVLTNAPVVRVMIADGRATGVEARVDGQTRHITARREVILSGGTIASPQILMRSGIGDATHLQSFGIAVVRHAPEVGGNLQDHLLAGVQYSSPSSLTYGISLRALPRIIADLAEYAFFRRGVMASNVIQSGGFVRTDPSLDRPDIQYAFLPALRGKRMPVGFGHGFELMGILMRPKSRGHVRLSGAGVDARPVIDPRFLSEPEDMEALLRGLKLSRRILEAPAFASVRGTELLPGPAIQDDEGLRNYIRNTTTTAFHPIGTCRMGADQGAVVDPQLRVRGIGNLRVVDASVMPTLIGGNTNGPTIMIAEKAADMILGRPPLPAATIG